MPISREDFLSTCAGDWSSCPLNSWRTPKQWLGELGEELESRGIDIAEGGRAGRK
jgi:hypothetical protein